MPVRDVKNYKKILLQIGLTAGIKSGKVHTIFESMTLARSVGRNTLIQFIGKVIGTAVGFVTSILIVRYLHPTGFGSYSTAMAFLGFFSVTADLGLYLILIRDLNRPGADREKIVGNLLALRWLSAAIILGVGAAIVWVLPLSHNEKVAVLIGTGSYIAVAATQLLVGIFQTNLAMGFVTVAELTGRFVLLGLTWWAVHASTGLSGVMTAVVSGSIVNFLLVWLSAGRFVKLRLQFDWAYWKATLRETLPISASIVLNLIYFRADTIILRAFKGTHDVGLYGASYKILEILNTFPIMFVGLLLPILGAAFASNDRERFMKVFQRGFDFLLMAAVPLLVGGWMLARPLMIFMGGGNDYASAAPVFRLLLIAVSALYLGSLSGHVVTIIHRQRQMLWSYLSVAILGLGLYLILIPRFSLYGAAIGTIATESVTALVGYILILKVMNFRLKMNMVWKLFLSASLMAGIIWLTGSWSWWTRIIVGACGYGLGLFATKALTWSTIREIIYPQTNTEPGLSVEELAP